MPKRKSTFNVIDALIIILIVAAGIGAYMLFFAPNSAISDGDKNEVSKIRYVIQVKELPLEYADNVKAGEPVFDYGTGISAGTVAAVDFKNSVYVGHDKTTGEQKLTTLDDFVDLYITVEGDAKTADHTYLINDTSMYIGKAIEMMTPELFCAGTCISLDTVE